MLYKVYNTFTRTSINVKQIIYHFYFYFYYIALGNSIKLFSTLNKPFTIYRGTLHKTIQHFLDNNQNFVSEKTANLETINTMCMFRTKTTVSTTCILVPDKHRIEKGSSSSGRLQWDVLSDRFLVYRTERNVYML